MWQARISPSAVSILDWDPAKGKQTAANIEAAESKRVSL
jgi:hypothetical protein